MSNVARDIFKDFNQKNNILDCIIENINLYKKSKKIGVELTAPHKITLAELTELENYLKIKFNIEKIEFNIKYNEKPKFTLEEDWKSVIKYVSLKMPIVKPIIIDSNIKIEDKTVSIILKTNTAEFLKSYKVDKALERLLLNLYGDKYIIKCVEAIDSEVIKNQHTYLEELEKEACKTVLENNAIAKTQAVVEQPEVIAGADTEEAEEVEEKKPLILGRSDKIKEALVKIKELSMDYGKVAIEGKIISTDTKELRNRKNIINV